MQCFCMVIGVNSPNSDYSSGGVFMKDPYVRTETVDLTPFRRDMVSGLFGGNEARYWHGMDCTTDRVIHLTPSAEWCVVRKIDCNGRLPSRARDPFLREIE